MVEPVTAFAFLNSAIKFSEYAVKLSNVGSENGVFVRLILRVRKDLEEVERLISTPSVKKRLISTPGKLPYIKDVIFSTKSALNDIGRWVDRVRADKEGYGSISFENRMRWVFNDHDKLTNRTLELSTNHHSLSSVLQYLMPLENAEVPNISENVSPPNYGDVTAVDDILATPPPMSSRQMRKYRDNKASVQEGKAGSVQQVKPSQASYQQNYLSPLPQTTSPDDVKPVTNSWTPQDSTLREARSSISLAQSYQNSDAVPQLTTRASFYGSESQGWSAPYGNNPPAPPKATESPNTQRRPLSRQSTNPSTCPSNAIPPSTMSSASLATFGNSQNEQANTYGMPSPVLVRPALNSSQSAPNQQGHGTSGENLGYPQISSPDQLPWSSEPPVSYSSGMNRERSSTTRATEATWTPSQQTGETQKFIAPQFSGTNDIGPINAFDMFAEMEAPSSTTPAPLTNPNWDQAPQTRAMSDQSQSISQFSPPIPPKTQDFDKRNDHVAELIGDLSLRQHKEVKYFEQQPLSSASTCHPLVSELPVDNSFGDNSTGKRKMPTNYGETSAGDTVGSRSSYSSTVDASADRYCAVERSQNPLPQFHTSPPTDVVKLQPQASSFPIPPISRGQTPSQNQFQYPPHSTHSTQGIQPQMYSQLEVQTQSHAQSQYSNHYQFNTQAPQSQTQFQYQTQALPQPQFYPQTQPAIYLPQSQAQPPYLQQISQNVSAIPPSPMSTYTPSPIPWSGQQQMNADTRPVSPPTQPATPAQTPASPDHHNHALSRSGTMAEQRRRNQRAMLNLLG